MRASSAWVDRQSNGHGPPTRPEGCKVPSARPITLIASSYTARASTKLGSPGYAKHHPMTCPGGCGGRCRRGGAANPGRGRDGDRGANGLPDPALRRAHPYADLSDARRGGGGLDGLADLLRRRALPAARSCGAQQPGRYAGLARSGIHSGRECPSDPCGTRSRGVARRMR
jgi:hypothetical protein